MNKHILFKCFFLLFALSMLDTNTAIAQKSRKKAKENIAQ
jgi:hypothetical protein